MHQKARKPHPHHNSHPSKPRHRTKLAILLPANIHLVFQRVNSVLIPAVRRRETQFASHQVVEEVGLHDGDGGVGIERVVLAERGDVAGGE